MEKEKYTESMIWYSKRQIWRKGPTLPSEPFIRDYCITTINSSSVVFTGGLDEKSHSSTLTKIFNFDLKKWTNLPKNENFDSNMHFVQCVAGTVFPKTPENVFVYLLSRKLFP